MNNKLDKSSNSVKFENSPIKANNVAGRDINIIKIIYNYLKKTPRPPEFTRIFDCLYTLIEKDDEKNSLKNNQEQLSKLLEQDKDYITKKIHYHNLSTHTVIEDISSHIMTLFNMQETDLFTLSKRTKINFYLNKMYKEYKYKNTEKESHEILTAMINELNNMIENSSYNDLGQDAIDLCISYCIYNAVLNCKVLEPAPKGYKDN
jgi:hypothetical protein